MKRTILVSAAALLAMSAVHANDLKGDVAAGKVKAQACHACHGSTGVSINTMWPNLAGQQIGYVVKQLKSFRDGTRADPFMQQFAKPLSDQDIADLAAYFNTLDGAPVQHPVDGYKPEALKK